MCSIAEDDFGDEGGAHAMEGSKGNGYTQTTGICKKCNAEGMLIQLEFRQPECKDCFLAYVHHKFRATLGSSKILPKGASVLLIFEGSAESIALLDMMYFAHTQTTFKRLNCKTKILLIDESQITPQTTTEDVKAVIEFLKKYQEHFQSYIISVAAENPIPISIMESNYYDELYCTGTTKKNRLTSQLANIKTLTSRQDFVKIYKKNLMQVAAEQLKCEFIFTSDTSTKLAAELLKSMCLGRGSSSALDVSLLDSRLPNVKIIRPMKDLNANEVELYRQVQNLPQFRLISYGEDDNRDPSSSIQNLTKRFVQDLQQNYSSTVSTVFRVGEKIAPKHGELQLNSSASTKCSFCCSHLDFHQSKTLVSLEVSRISCNFPGSIDKLNELAADGVHSRGDLCHGCFKIENDFVNKMNIL